MGVTRHLVDLECFQKELKKISSTKGFKLQIYVTRTVSSEEHVSLSTVSLDEKGLLNAADQPSSSAMPEVTPACHGDTVKLAVHRCRPDFSTLFSKSVSEKSCALVCGPAPMMLDVQREGGKCGFHVHEECF